MPVTSAADHAIEHEAPASVGQRMLWLIEHYRGGQGRLNYPLLLRITGELDLDALRLALGRLVSRHETLRTTFARRGGLLTQLVHPAGPVPVTAVPVTAPPGQPAAAPAAASPLAADLGTELWQHVLDEVTRPVDAKSTPIRVTLWSAGRSDHVLCLNAHHLVSDAWSCRILVEELALLLDGRTGLPPAGWQYRHYVQWQRRKTTAGRMDSDKAYWQQQLAGARAPSLPVSATGGPPAPLPAGGPSALTTHTLQVDIDQATWTRMRALARDEQTTPFAVLLSIYYALLHRESGAADLCVASPFANRVRPEVMRTVGFFANLLVLRTRCQPGSTFRGLVRATGQTVAEALAHQGFMHFLPPAGEGDEGARNIEDIIFQMLPELPPPITAGGLRIEVLPPIVASRFDLELCVLPGPDGLRALIQYAPDRIGGPLAHRLADGCAELTRRVAAGPDFTL